MKKIALFVLIAVLTLEFASCGAEVSIYDRGLEVVAMLDEMSQSADYIGVYSASEDIKSVIAASVGDRSTPSAVYELKVDEATLSGTADVNSMTDLSDGVREYVTNRSLATIITNINSRGGVNMLAASSVCTASMTFVNSEFEGYAVYLYTYENAAPVMVTFIAGEDGAVSASGNIVLYDGLDTTSAATIAAFFDEIKVEVTLLK